MASCPACGSMIQDGFRFCSVCGAESAAPAPPSRHQPANPPRDGSSPRWPLLAGALALLTAAAVAVVVLLAGDDGPTGTTAAGGTQATAGTTTTAPDATGPAPAWVLSEDQARVVEEFGLPGTFTLIIGEDADEVLAGLDIPDHRFEYWDYHAMGVRIVFRDGAVVATHPIEVLGPEYGYPAISPEWFAAGMTPDRVTAVMGMEPAAGGTLAPDVLDGYQMLIWDGVLAGSFADGVLVSIETAPVEAAG